MDKKLMRMRMMDKLAEKAAERQAARGSVPQLETFDEDEIKRRNNAAKIIQRAITRRSLHGKNYQQVWLDCVKGLDKQKAAMGVDIANKLGINPDECCVQAFRELRSDVITGNVEIVPLWDQVVAESKQVFALKKKKVRLEIFANGMELKLTHLPLTTRQASEPSSSSAAQAQTPSSAPTAQPSCAIRHSPQPYLHELKKGEEPEAKARNVLTDLLNLTSFELQYFHIGMGVFDRSLQEHDDSRLPGLITITDIMLVPIHVTQPMNLPKLGLPHGANFSVPGPCGSSLWNWPHMEASPPAVGKELRKLIGGQFEERLSSRTSQSVILKNDEDDEDSDIELGESSEDEGSALEWLCQSVLRNHSLRASWLRRPFSGRGPMLLLLHGLHEAACSCPMVLEVWFGKGLGAKDPSAQNIRDALGDLATHIIGDVMSQSSTLHEPTIDSCTLTQREWHVAELNLPGRAWGSDCRAREASVHSLCDLLRRSYAAEMCITIGAETALDQNQVSGGARSRVGEDARNLLADLLGGRGPLAALMSVTNLAAGIPGDGHTTESSEILNAPLEVIVKQLQKNDPLPRHVCEKLPGVTAASYRSSLTEDLILELQELSHAIKKLTARRWYQNNPWYTRCCVIHGRFDISHVLVGGLRQLWVAGLSGKHPCVDNALRDLADFSTSLLLEGCQLPVCDLDLSSIMDSSTDFTIGDLADWMDAEEHNLTEFIMTRIQSVRLAERASIKEYRHTQPVLPDLASGDASRDSTFENLGDIYARRSEVLLSTLNPLGDYRTWKSEVRRRSTNIDNAEGNAWAPEPPSPKRASYIDKARSRVSVPEFVGDRSASRKSTRRSTHKRPTVRKSTTGLKTEVSAEEEEKLAMAARDKEMLKAFGRRHKALVVPKRADARAAYMEAVWFSQEFAEQLPDALAGDGLGAPPETLQPGPRRWAWELQRLVTAFAADRLGALHDGVFDHPADKNDTAGGGRRTAALMMPLILATVGLLWRVPLWQRPWVLVHATCLAKKLGEVLGQIGEITKERSARGLTLRQQVMGEPRDTDEVSSGRSSLCSSRSGVRSRWPVGPWLPHVHFAKDHRLWVVNPSAEETDKTPIVAGIVTASSDIYHLDDDRELDIEEAVPILGLPCANLGMNIEQGRTRRRLARPRDKDSREIPAASRKRAFHHISELSKAGRCMTGKVLDAIHVRSAQGPVSENADLDRDQAERFSFTCANVVGGGFATLRDDMHMERISNAGAVIAFLDRTAKRVAGEARMSWLEKYVKYTWSYRSLDESVVIFGSGPAEVKSCLQKLITPPQKKNTTTEGLQRDGLRASIISPPVEASPKGNPFPGTLSYMEYRAEVAIESIFVEGESPEEALAEVAFSGMHAILPPPGARRASMAAGVFDSSDGDVSPRRVTGRSSRAKDKDKSTIAVQFNFKFQASEDVDIYPAGARLRIFRKDDLCGSAGTILSLCETGEYLLRMDGGAEVLRFDPCPWNCEPAGVYRYNLHQRLMVYDDGRWLNATVTNSLSSNYHELEVPSTYRRTLKLDLGECNHAPAWMSVLEFERAARKYASEIRTRHGFLVDPVSGCSIDTLTLPFSVAFFGSPLGQADALPELLSIVDPATERHRGVLEARGVVVWGVQSLGKTTLAKRLAVTCTYRVSGYLPLMVPVQDILSFMEHEADPLDTLLWDLYGSADRNLEMYKMLRQALYCRRVLIIFDGADANSAKFTSLLTFFQSLVDLGHRAVLLARPAPADNTLRPSNRPSFQSNRPSVHSNRPSFQSNRPSLQSNEDLEMETTAVADSSIDLSASSSLMTSTTLPVTISQSDSDVAAPDSLMSRVSGKLDTLVKLPSTPSVSMSRTPTASPKPSISSTGPSGSMTWMKSYAKSTAAAKQKATGVLLKAGTPPLLELELRPLTPETQQEAVAVRCGEQDGQWFKEHLHAANDISEHPFGLMLLLGHVKANPGSWITRSQRMSSYEGEGQPAARSPSFLMRMLQSALTMCLNQVLNQSLSVGVSQQPCNTDDCLQVLEVIALEIQRRGNDEILKNEVEESLHRQSDEHKLKLAWHRLSVAIEDQRLQILQGPRGYVHELYSAQTPVRFIHSSLQEYFVARCCVRYTSLQRPTGLPPFEHVLFEPSWARFFRYFFEILEIHKVSIALDFSGQDLPPERFDQLIDFFNSRDWRFPCVKLELSGCGQVPSANHLQRLLQSSMRALQGFSIRCYPLEAEGVSVFAHALSQHNPSLTFLDLRNCSVGCEGVRILSEVLARNALLVHLNLAGNAIGVQGAEHIAVALKTNTQLQFLELENNGLVSSGAAALSKCVHGCSNSALKYLGMAGNRITDEGAEHVVELMRARWSLQELDIAGNSILGVGFQRLAGGLVAHARLRQLCLSGNEGGPDGMWHISKALRMLQGSSALRRIHLDHTRLGFEGISHLAESIMEGATFECLELRGNRLGSKGVCRLSAALRVALSRGFCTLQRLGLCSNTCMDAGATALAAVLKDERAVLEDVDLSENQIGDDGASEIAIALRLEGVAASKCLRKLKLNANRLSSEGVEALANTLVERKDSKAVLESLDLSGNIIGDAGAIAMAAALVASPALRTVELQRGRISAAGASALINAVEQIKTIKRIGLSGNFVGHLFQPYVEDLCKIRVAHTSMSVSADVSATPKMKWVTEFNQDVTDQRERLGLPKVQPMSKYRDLLEGVVSLHDSPARRASNSFNSSLGASNNFSAMSRWSSVRSSVKKIGKVASVFNKLPKTPEKARPSTVTRGLSFGRQIAPPCAPPSRSTSIASTKASTETSRFNI